METKKLIILAPGAMKPFHDGHYSLMLSYIAASILSDMPVKEINAIISPKERSGISANTTVNFLNKISDKFLAQHNVELVAEISEVPSPISATFYKIMHDEDPNIVYTVLSSTKDGDDERLRSFKTGFSSEGRYSDFANKVVWLKDINQEPLVYRNRTDKFNNNPISATIARIDVSNDDFENFLTNYKLMLSDGIVTEDELREYFNDLREELVLSKDDIKKMNESNLLNNKYKDTTIENIFENNMIRNKKRMNEDWDERYADNPVVIINVRILGNVLGYSDEELDAYLEDEDGDDSLVPHRLIEMLNSLEKASAGGVKDDGDFMICRDLEIEDFFVICDEFGVRQHCAEFMDTENVEDILESYRAKIAKKSKKRMNEGFEDDDDDDRDFADVDLDHPTWAKDDDDIEYDDEDLDDDDLDPERDYDIQYNEETGKFEVVNVNECDLTESIKRDIRRGKLTEAAKAEEEKNQPKVDKSADTLTELVKFFKENKEELKNPDKTKEAIKKVKAEAKRMAKYGANYLDVVGMKDLKKKLAKIDPTINDIDSKLFKKVSEAISTQRPTLFNNVILEGKNLSEYGKTDIIRLQHNAERILNKLNEERKNLYINEGFRVGKSEREAILEKIEKYKNLLNILSEELYYRDAVLAKLFEGEEAQPAETSAAEAPAEEIPTSGNEGEEKTDDAAQNDDAQEEKNPDEDEVIEVSAITVEVKEVGKDEFLAELKNAGVPDDAITVIDDEKKEEKKEEKEEEKKEDEASEDKESEEKNESKKYSNAFKALLEGEDVQQEEGEELTDDDENDADNADNAEQSQEASTDEQPAEEKEEKTVRIRVNADYAPKLIDVLKDSYDFTDEEIDEYLGGEIVADDEKKDDETEETGDNGVDAFKNALADLNLDDIEDEEGV